MDHGRRGLGDPEVGELHRAGEREEDVRWADVAVDEVQRSSVLVLELVSVS